MKYFIAIVLSLITLQLNAQNYVYSYTDPCTGVLKSITVPINGSITVSYYGEVGTLDPKTVIKNILNSELTKVVCKSCFVGKL